MTKWIRYGMGTSLVVAVLLSGCGGASNPPGQTGTPRSTTTTATTAPTTTTLDISGLATTTTVPGDGVRLVDGAAPAERTVTITAGVFDPPELSISLGDVVTFKSGGLIAHSVLVGDLPGTVVTSGLVQTFQFTKPGTITVRTQGHDPTMDIVVAGAESPTGDAPTTTVAETTTTVAETTTTTG